ncbi:c-type cytochrome biogenesis protein CcsB [Fodinisporobacter ferrooxydans]|uniref:C-type cytochrome biogenesis protein CcsB n=1 Tax=Fodinisporobacter ferrooxydans TaxID=2901836 RepID=A0ABY4CIL9_9BACL|nr:c-type cytochrome biogenesis protein CcsB [Alicyclobacillaceae bacterium MYW30-H2]
MLSVSNWLYVVSFFGYMFSTILYIIGVTGKKIRFKHPLSKGNIWTHWGYRSAIVGVVAHLLAILLRGLVEQHIPVSNMFEYMSFWAFCIMLAFVTINAFYKFTVLGAFASPIGVVILGYASVFPTREMPLIPALQSYWLNIHVSTAALGEGILTIGFAAAFMYLLNVTNMHEKNSSTKFLEFTLFLFLTLFSFVLVSLLFKFLHYSVEDQGSGLAYDLPPLIGSSKSGSITHWIGLPLPLVKIPSSLQAVNQVLKLNTVLWSLFGGSVLYIGLRMLLRHPLVEVVGKWVKELDASILDELSYRAIAIGYPVFTLGALVFAMLWAQEAWGSYWSWDPKETWALITWLYYTAYLHLRLTKGWEGKKSAWMAVAGFVVILFLLVGVNFMIVGLHSYAGASM